MFFQIFTDLYFIDTGETMYLIFVKKMIQNWFKSEVENAHFIDKYTGF